MGLVTEYSTSDSFLVRLGRRSQWLVCFAASTAVVLLGVDFGRQYVLPGPWMKAPETFLQSLGNWDGNFFCSIVESGYSYVPGQPASVYFFPLYPLAGWCVTKLTGWSPRLALVVVSHLCFAASLYLLGRYMQRRYGAAQDGARCAALLALSFVPAGMYFHLSYTESLFLLLCIGQLYLIEYRAHPLLVALIVSLAIATRAVGIGLLAPLLMYLVYYTGRPKQKARQGDNQTRRQGEEPATKSPCLLVSLSPCLRSFLGWCCLCIPLALSGLIAYGAYCQWKFGDALIPIHDRAAYWAMRPLPTLAHKLLALSILQPVWENFVPSSPAFWGRFAIRAQFPFSLYVANSLYFVAAFGLVILGRWQRWLNGYEICATLALLLVPYWTVAYEFQMVSMARYVVVIVPLYQVAGQLFAKLPPVVGGCTLAASGLFLAAYAALFTRWYWLV